MPVVSSCCRVCSKLFDSHDCLLKCDQCFFFVHKNCSKLSAEELKCLASANRSLKFYCEDCVVGRLSKGFDRHINHSIELTESVAEDSDVHKIKTSFVDPIDLFSQWYNEHMAVNVNVTSAKAFSLATISKTGKVSCRSLILRRLDRDGFVMMTDGRSSKSKELAENPVASMVFLWLGKTTSNDNQTRQVRIEGVVNKLSTDNMQELYDIEPLFCKIRAQICEQGQPVEWNRLKRDHDLLLNKVINENIPLPKPDHVVAYKLVPNVMEFYETTGMKIADRLLFVKDDAFWRSKRLAA